MTVTAKKLNKYLMFKLPAAFICGVKLKKITDKNAIVTVKYKWINQNPFKSMYFAVQSMAAELSTGAIVIKKIKESGYNISSLVTNHSGTFTKKAIGKISFTCNDGLLLDEEIKKAIETGEGQSISLNTVGIDEDGDQVSNYTFEWSLKLRTKK